MGVDILQYMDINLFFTELNDSRNYLLDFQCSAGSNSQLSHRKRVRSTQRITADFC